jgi:methionyl aminopeptidase
MQKENIIKAGKIASEVREYAKSIIKKNVSILEIAEKIESKILELGGKPAFPVTISINEIAAHYTPGYGDEKVAEGLLKLDLGIHVEGSISDTAITFDLDNSEENKKLIEASEKSLNDAIKIINSETPLNEIGKIIQKRIESYGFSPIVNLSGHEILDYDLHAGITIPNFDNKNKNKIGEGIRAIEPFATTGSGRVYEGKPSGIYILVNSKNIRNPSARKILNFIEEEYQTLPFCSRWLVKKFGVIANFSLKQLEENGNINQFSQLVEASHKKVAQAEHTLFIEKDKLTITTK